MTEETAEEIRALTLAAGKRDIIDALEILSDRETQYDLWMNPNTPGMSSLEEDEHALFNGLERVLGKDKLKDIFSSDVCKKLEQLKKVIRHNESKDLGFSKKRFDHPKMVEMRKLSSELFPIMKKELKKF